MLLKNTFIYADAQEILDILPQLEEGKNELSSPTGNFFYDPWELLPQYKGTALETLYNKLPEAGQARVMLIKEGTCYSEHADIDDRYHLTLDAESSYLIDLDNRVMNATTVDDTIFLMDGGIIHSAVNFGHLPRAELVVRKLLTHNKLKDPARINLTVRYDVFDLRYRFDMVFSPWLNRANKKGIIDNFEPISETELNLDLEKKYIDKFKTLIEVSELDMELKID
tara:strand:+ start:12516 stop:13190 length:675 start_codon:yes stop_codon:yes gene_type:complete